MKVPAFAAALAALSSMPVAHSAEADFGWFGSLAGSCWVGAFPDGKTIHTQCYTRQIDKFLRGTAKLASERDGQQTTRFEGDSLFAWDGSNRRLTYYIWGSDGSHRQLEAHFVGEELSFPVPSRKEPGQVAYRSVWRRIGESSFEVRRERPSAGTWTIEMTVVYLRAPLGSGAAAR